MLALHGYAFDKENRVNPLPIESRLPGTGTTIFTVMTALANEHGAINLGQGFPDFSPPRELVDALKRALDAGHHQYAPLPGLPALRTALARRVLDDYGARVDPETEITITAGASEAIFDAIQCVVHPGDEIVVFDPCYDLYAPAVRLAGGHVVHVPLRGENFGLDLDALADALSPRTRLVVINSPHNPSGATLSATEMAGLESLLEGSRTWLLSDEVYEHMVYDRQRHESVLRYPGLAERAFMVGSFGKTYHCTGWKIGYCIAPQALSAEFRRVHQYNTFCVFHPAQHALAEMLEAHPEFHQGLAGFYQQRRDRFRALLADTRLALRPVPGGYFQLVDYSAVSDLPDTEFARWLTIEHGVAAIPIAPFQAEPPAGQRLVRLCFAKDEATLERAVTRLATL